MAILDILWKDRKSKTKTIDNLSMDELINEKYILEEKQHKCDDEYKKEEKAKQQLFLKGTDPGVSRMERTMLGNKLVELDERLKETYNKFSICNLQLRAVRRFIAIKEKQAELQESGLWSTLNRIPQDELERWATTNSVKDKKLVDSLTNVNRILGDSASVVFQEIDEKVSEYVRLMEVAAESGNPEVDWEKVRKATETDMETPIS